MRTLYSELGIDGEFVISDVRRSLFPMPSNRPIRELRVFQVLPKEGNHTANQPRIGHANAESARLLQRLGGTGNIYAVQTQPDANLHIHTYTHLHVHANPYTDFDTDTHADTDGDAVIHEMCHVVCRSLTRGLS